MLWRGRSLRIHTRRKLSEIRCLDKYGLHSTNIIWMLGSGLATLFILMVLDIFVLAEWLWLEVCWTYSLILTH
jgi:hypothetical protein